MVKNATRPVMFKWRQTAPELILCAVRWYLRYSLSLRDVEELFTERGLAADHTTIWRCSKELIGRRQGSPVGFSAPRLRFIHWVIFQFLFRPGSRAF